MPATTLRVSSLRTLLYLFVFAIALLAGGISGVIGTGSSLILLPVLVSVYGPKAAIPIMAVAAVMGNLARALVWWRDTDWRAALAFALPGVPAAALGARTMLSLPAWSIDAGLGVFFLTMVWVRRHLARGQRRLSLAQLAACGAAIGFLTGLVLSTGPLSVPAFTAYGLSGGTFLGTEALSSLFLYVGKVITFASQGALPWPVLAQGLLTGAGIMLGTALGKPLVLALSKTTYDRLLDGLLIVSGITFFWMATRH